jgi:ribosomal peptide maturation radical SAM protein 1
MVTQNRVLLVCPPFQSAGMSSLATAHLATYLRNADVDCIEDYAYLDFAQTIGPTLYAEASEGNRSHGELLFAEGLHALPADEVREAKLAGYGSRAERDRLREAFVLRCVETILASDAEIIGFTTSFNQLMASLYIAREVKRTAPDRKIVLGGAACQDPMGQTILAAYGHVDYVVSGAGELPLLRIGRGERPIERLVESPQAVDLEAMPVPDYAPFFAAMQEKGWSQSVALAFETSRGCWWGQKHHCRFCGINGEGMRFRAKSSARAVAEIRQLWEKHRVNLFATDAILPLHYVEEVMVELGRHTEGPKIFYELKSPMSEADIAVLARARVQGQPGLETLNTHLLKLLDKGGSSIQNVAFLKWCRERGMAIGWNQLYAIPGEELVDYESQIALMQWIVHFPPPISVNPIRIARYSPYFNEYSKYGWTHIEPMPEYVSLHPHLNQRDLINIAPFFVGEGGPDVTAYEERFRKAVEDWSSKNERGDGLFLDPVAGLVRNENGGGFQFSRHPVLDAVIAATHEVATIEQVMTKTSCGMPTLKEMQRLGLVYIEGDHILNLAVRTNLDVERQRAT